MAAKVESAGNDTKKISEAMGDLDKEVKQLQDYLDDMKKLIAQINKKPDECAKPMTQLLADITAFGKRSASLDTIAKDVKSAVAK